MLALLLFLAAAWAATAAGRTLLRGLRLPESATSLERNLTGFALGLSVLSYGMLVLGLLGGLYPLAGAAWMGLLALAGWREYSEMGRALRVVSRPHGVGWGIAALFAAFAAFALCGVYSPPTPLEWDSLAYHLADPKLYAQAHRIYYLPWESHSNFAFTAEMWYTLGLLWHSVPLAKWFHFACGAGTCLAAYALGARFFSRRVGIGAALLLASTPLVFWEAGTAYADLATTFFATLTLLAVATGMRENSERWLTAGAVLMGLTLSTKATALTTLGLLALGLLAWRLRARQGPARAIGQTAAWCALALLVGSPWYIKSLAYTGNPIYPFYFKLFGGRYWSATDAAAYDQSNAAFGMGRSPSDLILLPWNLTHYLLPGHPTAYPEAFNNFPTALMSLSPLLLATLFFPLFRRGPTPLVVKALALYALGGALLWFATAQHIRYLLPLLPVLCLLSAWAGGEAWRARGLTTYALAGLAVCSCLFSLLVGGQLARTQLPVALGRESQAAYLTRSDATYPAMQFVNTQLPAAARIVFYGNPLGFYCDRPYLWGEQGHSNFIPYDTFHSAQDLLRWFQQQGVTHVLVNPRYFALVPGSQWPGWVYQLTAGTGPPVFAERGVFVYALPRAGVYPR